MTLDPVIFPADRADRDRAYSPSSCVPDIQPFLDHYSNESLRVRHGVSFQTVRYGPGPRAEFDLFEAEAGRVHCFVHGGYWQQLSKDTGSFPAEQFVAHGTTYVAVGYDLCPAVSLREIVEQVRSAVGRVRADYPGAELTLSGSSAGAHLAAMAALTEGVDRMILLSGVYDLRPLVSTYVNDVVGLDIENAARLSPLLMDPPAAGVKAKVVWGSNETDAFKRQSQRYAEHLGVTGIEIPGRNHFDLVHDLFSVTDR